MQALQALFMTQKQIEGTTRVPWTRATALQLGRLYMQAWGVPPHAARCAGEYCLPPLGAIRRLFGTLTQYHLALQTEAHQEETCL
jgi:hypothetical protein